MLKYILFQWLLPTSFVPFMGLKFYELFCLYWSKASFTTDFAVVQAHISHF